MVDVLKPSDSTTYQHCEPARHKLAQEAFAEVPIPGKDSTAKPTDFVPLGLPQFEITWNFQYKEVDQDRKALLELAGKTIKDADLLRKFKGDVALFEHRGHGDGLSAREIKETYTNIARILKAGPDARLKDTDRAAVAHQIMRQAAEPSSIDQGNHNTCNVTSIENMLYTKEPSRVAGLIADVVTTGRYQGAKGKPVSVPNSAFVPDNEARNPVTVDGERSFASQLFQVTAVNLYYQNQDSILRYEQFDGNPRDTGERLRPWGIVPVGKTSPNLGTSQLADIHELIVGRKDPMLVLQHTSYSASDRENIKHFTSENDFKNILEEAQRLKKFPLILAVSGSNGGWHVVNIKGYDKKARMYLLDNSWGKESDKRVSLSELYALTTTPEWRAKADVVADMPNASPHMLEISTLELLWERGVAVKPEALSTALHNADKALKVRADEATDDSLERRQHLSAAENIFKSFDFRTRLEFLKQMTDFTSDSSYEQRALERFFATTAYEVGFDVNSLNNPGRQNGEFARAIVAIWSTLPQIRQQRILAAMAKKHS